MKFPYMDRETNTSNPSHYRGDDEETVDKIARRCAERWGTPQLAREIIEIVDANTTDDAETLIAELVARIAFQGFCFGNNIKYLDRKGRKGTVEEDQEKANWYDQMDVHTDGLGYPDPRERPLYALDWENSEESQS